MRGFAGSRLRYPAGVGVRVRGVRATLSGSRLRYLAGGWCGFAGSRVRGFAGSRLRYPAGVGVRVRGVRATLSGSRLRYLASGWCGFAGSRLRYPAGVGVRVRGVRATLSGWCGCAGARGSGNVIWMVWLISWLVGAGVRESEGSKLRYLVGVVFRCACWLVLCGWA